MIRKNIYFPRQLLDRVKEGCRKTGMKASELIRRAVDEFLQRMGL